MKVFLWHGSGGIIDSGGSYTSGGELIGDSPIDESQLTKLSADVSDGVATIHRKIFFEAEHPYEDAIDILNLPEFPAKLSAHPRHAGFKYYGNATVAPVTEGSKYWVADLEYSAVDPNATDDDDQPINDDTPPWKLRPDNIQFNYPEIIKPFEASYTSGGQMYDSEGHALLPVANTAGDKIPLERSVRNLQLSFTFATQHWSVNNALIYGNSINAEDITVCGLEIPAHKALLLPPDCTYITVYKDGTAEVKWQYWTVNITIQIDRTGDILYRKVLDIGNRAKFPAISLANDQYLQAAVSGGMVGLNTTLPATDTPSQICHFRMLKEMDARYSDGTKEFWPVLSGGLVFCSWEQYLAARQLYTAAGRFLMNKKTINSQYDLQCEQDTQMPLSGGYLYTRVIQGHSDYVSGASYRTLSFREYPFKSWSSLNLPSRGMG